MPRSGRDDISVPRYSRSVLPSFRPSVLPSFRPSVLPSFRPSVLPSFRPSVLPSFRPSVLPSFRPSVLPSFRPSVLPSFRLSMHQLLVPDPMRLVRVHALAALEIRRVLAVVPLEPDHLAVALERQDVGRDAVEEPAVVADDHGAAREAEQGLLEAPQR